VGTNTVRRTLIWWCCVVLLLMLGCRSVGAVPTSDTSPAPPTGAPTSIAATSTATTGAVPEPPTAARPEADATASPPARPFSVTLDGQAVSRDSLPSPDAYYAELLARHGRDLSSCYGEASPEPKTCTKPTSLGEIELKQQVNVELILDASGSMAERSGGETRLDVARRVLSEFVTTLPATANVALRVYGHQGSGADADKGTSCTASDLVYPFQPLDVGQFRAAVSRFNSSGWTPLAASLDRARADFEQFDPATSSNFVYVVTDGIETCDGDPVDAAQKLHAASVQPIVNVIGFDVDAEATRQLRQTAQRGGGTYYEARGGDELASVFKSKIDWGSWTAYYNCRYGVAVRQFNASTAIATRTMNCVQGHISRERNALNGEATRRFNDIHAAAIDASLAAGTPAASHEANALIARARENLEYARQRESERYARIYNAERGQWEGATRDAQAEWERARRELDQIRERRDASE
jgi:Ca-activated chloride channel homolog